MVEYPHHPFADMFPMRPGKPLTDLATSIAEHGQKEDIVLFEGQVLDGRRRQMAALRVGIQPRYRDFGSRPGDGGNALEFAFATNFHRRDDLTVAEKSLAAARYCNMKRGHNQHSTEPSNGNVAAPLVSRQQAAAKFGINEHAVSRAKAVLTKGVPDLLDAVRSETVSISDAAAIVSEPPAVQQQALTTVQAGETKTLREAVQKAKGTPSEDPALIGRDLTALILRLECVEADNAKTLDLACKRLRRGLELIGKLKPAAAACV